MSDQLKPSDIQSVAAMLSAALDNRRPIGPVSELFPGIDVADAYAIQRANLARRCATGASVVGHKIGLTSEPMQQLLGVDEPDFGYIVDDMVFESGATLAVDAFCAPRVEPELAFLLHSPLRGPGVTVADVLAATEALAPALEIVDSRIVDWRITLEDTIADNASSAAVVLGEWVPLDDAPSPAKLCAALQINGVVTHIGSGRAVMNDPVIAVAWLANALAPFGTTIEAGQFVMSGSFTAADFVHPGDRAAAHMPGFGAAHVTFK